MKTEDIIYVDKHKVQCEGIGGAAGHPRVYLEIKDDKVICPYCERIFKLKKMEV